MQTSSNTHDLHTFQLTLAHQAGWLDVVARDRTALESAINEVRHLVVEIDEGIPVSDDRTEAYFLGESVYRSRLDDLIRTLTSRRQLWWIADNPKEAAAWEKEVTDKGATIVAMDPVDPKSPSGQISVVFAIDPAQAERFFGSKDAIEPETYLDEDLVRL